MFRYKYSVPCFVRVVFVVDSRTAVLRTNYQYRILLNKVLLYNTTGVPKYVCAQVKKYLNTQLSNYYTTDRLLTLRLLPRVKYMYHLNIYTMYSTVLVLDWSTAAHDL